MKKNCRFIIPTEYSFLAAIEAQEKGKELVTVY